MDWAKWTEKLLMTVALVALPVISQELTAVQADPELSIWAGFIVGAVLVGVKQLINYLKHRDDPAPAAPA